MDIHICHRLSLLNLALRLPLELHYDLFYLSEISDLREFQYWECFSSSVVDFKSIWIFFFQGDSFGGFLLWFSLLIITVFQIRALHLIFYLHSTCVCSEGKCLVFVRCYFINKKQMKRSFLCKLKGKEAGLKVGLKVFFKNIWGLALLSLMPD